MAAPVCGTLHCSTGQARPGKYSECGAVVEYALQPFRSVGPADRCSFENALFFEKLHPDTLFFIFYYQPGTYQQYCPPPQLPHPPGHNT